MKGNKTHICKYCGKQFETHQSLGAHTIVCKENPKNHQSEFQRRRKESINSKNPLETHILKCEICGSEFYLDIRESKFRSGNYRHTCSRHCASILTAKNTDLVSKNALISTQLSGKIKNSRTKEKVCVSCGKKFIPPILSNGKQSTRNTCSEECLKKTISSKAIQNKNGGLRENAYKRYRSGTYNGIHCDSSWELAFLIYCKDHNITIDRNNVPLEYSFNGKTFKYYPDFIIDGILYEIKGYESEIAKAKHEQHPEVIYLDKTKMQPYLKYVTTKYGKDFIRLYDRIDKSAK